MTTLAKLVVKLEAQTAKFQKDLERAEKKTKKFGRTTKNSLKGINQLFAGLAIGVATKKILDATAKQEAAFKQLEQGIKSTNQVVGFSAKELANYAGELQAVTNFGDEDIIAAQSQLVTFTRITGDEFLRTTELALDMAQRFGTDVKSATIQFGKALNDPIANLSALSRAGIQFTQDQKDMIKAMIESGDQVSAQKLILAELETQFGGSARAARDTFGGALKGLGNAFGDLLESKTGLKEAQKSIEELTNTLSDPKTKEGADKLVSTLISGFTKLASVLAQIPDFATFLGESVAAAVHGSADILRIDQDIAKEKEKLHQLEVDAAIFRRRNNGKLTEQQENEISLLKQSIELLNTKRELFTPKAPPKLNISDGISETPALEENTNVVPIDIAANKALEDAIKRAEQIVAETTPKIDQVNAKILESVTLFSKGLLDDTQFKQATDLYNAQLEGIVNKDRAAFEEKIVRLEEEFLSEFEILDQQKQQRLALVDEEIASKVLSEEKLASLKLKIEDKYKKDKKKLEDAAAQAEIKTALTVATGVLGIMSAFAGKSFKAQKALAIAEGIINIIGGVTKALNNPYPANLGFAAQVAAQGSGLMSTIKGTQLSSTGANFNVSGGAGSANTFSTPDVANQVQSTNQENTENQFKKIVELNMTVDEFTEQPMRKLIDKISETGKDLGIEFALRA